MTENSGPMQPGPDDALRAGNADRERVVAQLNRAFAEGRLDVGELDERVAAAYRAKTLGELRPLTADLPSERSPAPRPAAPAPIPIPPGGGVRPAEDGTMWGVRAAAGIFLVNVLIWAAVSIGNRELIYFWPIWTAIPLVLALAGLAGTRRRRD